MCRTTVLDTSTTKAFCSELNEVESVVVSLKEGCVEFVSATLFSEFSWYPTPFCIHIATLACNLNMALR